MGHTHLSLKFGSPVHGVHHGIITGLALGYVDNGGMNSLRLVPLLSGLLFLTGCGGGSSAPPASPTPQTCGFALVYADGGTSGYAVNPLATSVPKSITPCGITQVQSVTLGLCVSPADVSELKVQLLGSGGTTVPVNLATATASGSCLLTGSLYSVSLPIGALSSITDRWQLSVQDTVSGYNSSYFVGWSLEVKGLK